jgi:hypothetical protein
LYLVVPIYFDSDPHELVVRPVIRDPDSKRHAMVGRRVDETHSRRQFRPLCELDRPRHPRGRGHDERRHEASVAGDQIDPRAFGRDGAHLRAREFVEEIDQQRRAGRAAAGDEDGEDQCDSATIGSQ